MVVLAARTNDESHVFDMNIQRRRNGLSPFFVSFRYPFALRVSWGWVLCYYYASHVVLSLGLE